MIFNLLHYFFPSESNNFRAKIIHSSAFLFYLTVIVTLQVGFNILSFVNPGVLGYATDISIERLLELTNQKRIENGLNPLNLDPQLCQAANAKANDMFANNYWAHNSPTGVSPWDFILAAGYHYVYAGENLAKDFANSEGVVSAWMASPTHRDNIINPKYKDIGFAVVNGKLNGMETTLVVQMFGSRAPVTAGTFQVLPTNQPTFIPTVAPTVVPTSSPLNSYLISPKPTEIPVITPFKKSSPEILIAESENKSSKTIPKLNIFSLTKGFSLGLVIILILVLAIDGYIAFKEKHIRITGDNIAHIGFLLILVLATLATSVGMIM